MTDKMSDENVRWCAEHSYVRGVRSMAEELLTLRRREREARETMTMIASYTGRDEAGHFMREWAKKWLSEGAGGKK